MSWGSFQRHLTEEGKPTVSVGSMSPRFRSVTDFKKGVLGELPEHQPASDQLWSICCYAFPALVDYIPTHWPRIDLSSVQFLVGYLLQWEIQSVELPTPSICYRLFYMVSALFRNLIYITILFKMPEMYLWVLENFPLVFNHFLWDQETARRWSNDFCSVCGNVS